MRTSLVCGALTVILLSACGARADVDAPDSESPEGVGAPEATAAPTRSVAPTPARQSRAPDRRPATTTTGIDVSHHQGVIDWQQVSGDGHRFVYMKATEGSTFTDPRFVENWNGARAAGLRTGAYHYYSLCTPPGPQAAHYLRTVTAQPQGRALPPVVDLELIGNCDPPPDRDTLLAEVRRYITLVEQELAPVTVYFHPDFEQRYGLVADLGREVWVRAIGEDPPRGDWLVWQRSQAGTVAGIAGPVDINEHRRLSGTRLR